ncbi:hypothetical protein DAPPUDRAFT_115237 [Daphnia pulex]|uniref:Uncharacterized protein n=1 Tax=Daphnia pulex TaxID=6669 RepID=E9HKP5_DAPPU|nr:hypothetical protein DAPPUDRAFT_115237 [Daphnia pulex]|eukprot:EFX67694.1 hypothetical protein DAPPUDRAFT_115237 [Daphnia pulex]
MTNVVRLAHLDRMRSVMSDVKLLPYHGLTGEVDKRHKSYAGLDQGGRARQYPHCFVTGKWKENVDAEELLAMDDFDDMKSEGDFEDLETGEVSQAGKKSGAENKDDSPEDEGKRLIEKKPKLKEQFNSEYDEGGSKKTKTYYDDLKEEMDQQAQLNKNVPCELLLNFNPIYPLIVGALMPGEEKIGFVQWSQALASIRSTLIPSLEGIDLAGRALEWQLKNDNLFPSLADQIRIGEANGVSGLSDVDYPMLEVGPNGLPLLRQMGLVNRLP